MANGNGACADPQVQSGFAPNAYESFSTPLILSTMQLPTKSSQAPDVQPVEGAESAPTGTIMADKGCPFPPWLLLAIIAGVFLMLRR